MALPIRTSLIFKLKQRKIVQWTVAYLSAAWLTLQVVDVIGEQFAWPAALERGITGVLAAGLLITLVLAWFHGEKGQQRVTRLELAVLSVVLVASGFIVRAVAGEPAAGDNPAAASLAAADPNAIVVAPFAAAAPDSALARLGRDLSFTVAATLDGLQDMRTVDPQTVLARANPAGAGLSLPGAVLLASELGAGRVLHGSLTRSGQQVRVDATLYATDASRALARVTALADADRIDVLTDSIVLALARQLWQRTTPEIPSAASLRTSSVDALRAYLDGEHALAAGEMPQAIAAFEQAYAHDSTYVFAYWRSLYPRTYEGSRPDSTALARLVRYRDELPTVDRLLVEVGTADTLSGRQTLLESALRRFPTHWPAWYTYANLLVHQTPYLGTSLEEARAALERVTQLNPGFAPGWEHLFWIVTLLRDREGTAATLDAIERFSTPSGYRFNEDLMNQYAAIADAVVNGDSLSAQQLASTVDYVLGYRGPIPLHSFGIGLLASGLPRAQMQFNDAVLRTNPTGALAEGMWQGLALGAAARGDWDAAVTAADRWARMNGSFITAVDAYGLVVTGAALGFVDAEAAALRRPADVPADARPEARAQLAWLDGVIAWAQRDAAALDGARNELMRSGSQLLPLLGATLGALDLDLRGQRDAAAQRLLAAEDSAAERAAQQRYARTHPYLTSVNRLLAARWLLESGRPADAAHLLTFSGAVLPGVPPLNVANLTVGSVSLYYLARAEDAMGRQSDARGHYERFVDQFDRPAPALESLLRDARTRLAQLTRG